MACELPQIVANACLILGCYLWYSQALLLGVCWKMGTYFPNFIADNYAMMAWTNPLNQAEMG